MERKWSVRSVIVSDTSHFRATGERAQSRRHRRVSGGNSAPFQGLSAMRYGWTSLFISLISVGVEKSVTMAQPSSVSASIRLAVSEAGNLWIWVVVVFEGIPNWYGF